MTTEFSLDLQSMLIGIQNKIQEWVSVTGQVIDMYEEIQRVMRQADLLLTQLDSSEKSVKKDWKF